MEIPQEVLDKLQAIADLYDDSATVFNLLLDHIRGGHFLKGDDGEIFLIDTLLVHQKILRRRREDAKLKHSHGGIEAMLQASKIPSHFAPRASDSRRPSLDMIEEDTHRFG